MDMDFRRFGLPSPREAMEEDDGVVELSLGLSIGGSSRKARRSVPGLGSGEEGTDHGGSGASVPPLLLPFPGGDLTNCLDLQRRREVHHAVRRQEARKERHGKQPLEAQEEGGGLRDREAREEEARHSDRRAGENHGPGSDPVPDPQLCPSSNGNPNAGANKPSPIISPNFANQDLPLLGAPHPFPVVAMQCPYPPVQVVPMANGFGIPYMMPCWAPAIPSVTGGPNPASDLFQPVTRRTFQPDAEPSNGASPLSSKMVDLLSGGKYVDSEGIERATSCTGSLGSNNGSSAISTDYQSDSLQGGSSSSSDSRSRSSLAPAESSYHPHMSNLVQGQSEHSVSSRRIEPAADAVEAPSKKRPTPYAASSNPTPSGASGDPTPTLCAPAKLERMISANKPVPAADEPPSPLPRMPCVSTTGNGPNGRTITGFLYRYTSMEVSIVCVCHGSSFSPAGFVKHAGGTETANPLKHIIVVPS